MEAAEACEERARWPFACTSSGAEIVGWQNSGNRAAFREGNHRAFGGISRGIEGVRGHVVIRYRLYKRSLQT